MELTLKRLEAYLIGAGSERRCYRNPDNPATVIKLSCSAKKSGKGDSIQTQREIAYYAFLKKKGVPLTQLPDIIRTLEIEGREGFEQAAVLDADGKPSRTLFYYLLEDRCSSISLDEVRRLLDILKNYLMRWNIVSCDINGSNILLQHRADGSWHPMIIDGLGTMDFIPLCQYVPWWGRRKLARHWDKLQMKIRNKGVAL